MRRFRVVWIFAPVKTFVSVVGVITEYVVACGIGRRHIVQTRRPSRVASDSGEDRELVVVDRFSHIQVVYMFN
jgi:hypothetical protein